MWKIGTLVRFVGETVKWCSHCGKYYAVPQKIKTKTTIWLHGSNSVPQRIESRVSRAICTFMFIAAAFVIAKQWRQPKCPWTGEWINTMWYLHTMEYDAAFKRKEALTHAATWMILEDIMVSEISQTTKDRYCMIPLLWVSRVVKSIETESRRIIARGCESVTLLFNGYSISF